MRVLLDESVHRAFGRGLVSHQVTTVAREGWASLGNGELLKRAAAAGFDALLTMDRSLEYQQNIAQAGVGVVVLIAPSNRIADLWPLTAEVDRALASLQPGQVIHVGTEYWKDRDRLP